MDACKASIHVLTGVLLAAGLAGCAAATPAGESLLSQPETVIGRARVDDEVVVLTDAPALVFIRAEGKEIIRRPLSIPPGQGMRLWGLGETDGELFTVSAFSELARLTRDGAFQPVARLPRPVSNFFDLAEGMAAQDGTGGAKRPLAVGVTAAGAFVAIKAPARDPLPVTDVEAGLLHLLSCSAPPLVVCWLPDGRVLEEQPGALSDWRRLEGIEAVPPATLIARPEQRAIQDALMDAAGRYLVLLSPSAGSDSQRLLELDDAARLVSVRALDEPVRMLIGASPDTVLAVGRAGQLLRVGRR